MVLTRGEGYFIPEFIFDGEQPPEKLKEKIGLTLIKVHNEYGAFTRPYYSGWNAAYDGPMDHLDENECLLPATKSEYMLYMKKCISKIMPLFNKRVVTKNKYFKKYMVGDELEIIGVMKNGCKVSFLMREVPLEDLIKKYKGED